MCSFLGVFSSVQFLLNDILASLFCMSETFYVNFLKIDFEKNTFSAKGVAITLRPQKNLRLKSP